MKSKLILLLLSLPAIAGCQPSAQSIETAIAGTQAMAVTIEVVPPTATKLPPDTPIPSLTPTATIVPSSTPDPRVFDIDPRNLLLQKEHLPGRYYLPNEQSMSPLTNSEIVSSWTVEEGQAFLTETGRIHGWEIMYNRAANNAIFPRGVYHTVALFSTMEGPQIAIEKYSGRNIENDHKEIDAPQIGDLSQVYERRETDASGATRVSLRLEFADRNLYHGIVLSGVDNEVSLDFAIDVANTLLEQTGELPLSDSVTFLP